MLRLAMMRPNISDYMPVASSPGYRGYRDDCYAELTVSSPAVAEAIASTHCSDPRRDGQAEWPEKY